MIRIPRGHGPYDIAACRRGMTADLLPLTAVVYVIQAACSWMHVAVSYAVAALAAPKLNEI